MPTEGQLISQLAQIIDHDQPPGLAARVLAAAVVELVRDRGGKEAALILDDVRALGAKHLRAR
jgi:hypothetical protein